MTISTILWTIGTFVLVLLHSAVGLSEINPTQVIKDEGEVFEFESANKPVTSTIRLLDRPTLEHGIVRRDTSDSGEPDLSEDNHVYYNMIIAKSHPMSTYYSSEFDRIFSAYSIRSNIKLNNGKNLALTIPLVFSFDFYGHSVKSIVLTTSGFIYVNDLTHPYLTFSQYIAPMMADFETRKSVSAIKYVEAEDAFWGALGESGTVLRKIWCYDLGRCSSGPVDLSRLQELRHDSECHYSAGGTCGDGDRSIVPLGRTGTKQPPEAASRRSAGQVALGVCLGILALAAVATVAGVLLRLGAWLIEHRPSRYRERFFGASGGGASGTGGASESYKLHTASSAHTFACP
uniref:Malectin_like domain-containing protein n=1 Tax=Macrostomum lignano TaxID=282301 RepID=A0A1I8F3B6_9PLAT